MSAEENKAAFRRYLEEVDKGNLAIVDELLAPECVFHYPDLDVNGSGEMKEMIKVFQTAFPDWTHSIQDMVATEDTLAARLIDRGTHQGDFKEITPTGKQVSLSVMGFCRFTNGRFAEVWIEYDMLGLMQQLGMELKPKESA